ncbi:MAG TPA: hypothetical protein PLZ95_00620 [Bryobacteraceae bacterium]|nr:hypothetical protein [Bryobacteraceae bacterium]
MRAILFFLALGLAAAQTPAEPPASTAQLPGIKNVYLLPMPNGLEQFIANQLVKRGVLGVVADPQMADAVFTDTVGSGFQQRMGELYPAPKPPEPEEDEKDAKAKRPGSEAKDAGGGAVRMGALSRGKGTIFLVDRKSSQVLWSAYVRPKSSSPRDLDRAAKTIADRIAASVKRSSEPSH